MEILVGRLTADAKTETISDDRQVVHFTIAINENFKSKSGKRPVKFVDCSYWKNIGIQPFLKKGHLVELYGSTTARAWINHQGEAQAALNCNVNNILLHGGGKKEMRSEETHIQNIPAGDLPF
jgi:single-strand DNA-binding protein